MGYEYMMILSFLLIADTEYWHVFTSYRNSILTLHTTTESCPLHDILIGSYVLSTNLVDWCNDAITDIQATHLRTRGIVHHVLATGAWHTYMYLRTKKNISVLLKNMCLVFANNNKNILNECIVYWYNTTLFVEKNRFRHWMNSV